MYVCIRCAFLAMLETELSVSRVETNIESDFTCPSYKTLALKSIGWKFYYYRRDNQKCNQLKCHTDKSFSRNKIHNLRGGCWAELYLHPKLNRKTWWKKFFFQPNFQTAVEFNCNHGNRSWDQSKCGFVFQIFQKKYEDVSMGGVSATEKFITHELEKLTPQVIIRDGHQLFLLKTDNGISISQETKWNLNTVFDNWNMA